MGFTSAVARAATRAKGASKKLDAAKEAIDIAKSVKETASQVKDLAKDVKGAAKADVAKAILSAAKENPLDVATLASGTAGDPLAVASGASLAAEVDKKLKEQLGSIDKKTVATAAVGAATGAAITGATVSSEKRSESDMVESKTETTTTQTATSNADSSLKALSVALFLWVCGVQIFDFLQNFKRSGLYGTLTLFYVFTAVFAAFVFRKRNLFKNLEQFLWFLLLSAASIGIPFYLKYFGEGNFLGIPGLFYWASFFFAIFPIWPLYVAHKLSYIYGDKILVTKLANAWTTIWIFGLVLVFIFAFSTQVNASVVVRMGGSVDGLEVGPVWNYLLQKVDGIVKYYYGELKDVPGKLAYNFMNASGIYYYTGVLEQDETKQPVGLYIDNVRPADKYFYEGYPVIVWADVRGKSFKEEIYVTPHCYVDTKGSKTGIDGVTKPAYMSILGEEHDSLQCTFDKLPAGSYLVKLDASFNFQTEAYVTYSFVDMELKRSIEVQGKSVTAELEVLPYPLALYTNGPVMLGMGSTVDQPVPIDTKNNQRDSILGVTLDNRWTEGNLERVNYIILQVPDDFELNNCDRWYPEVKKEPFESKDGYNNYKFTREELNDHRVQFKSVTCRIHVKDPKKFLAGQQKVQRTFVAIADYDYLLQKSASISVKK